MSIAIQRTRHNTSKETINVFLNELQRVASIAFHDFDAGAAANDNPAIVAAETSNEGNLCVQDKFIYGSFKNSKITLQPNRTQQLLMTFARVQQQ